MSEPEDTAHGGREVGALFGAYAGFYDALYADKDYEAEVRFLAEVFAAQGVPEGGSVLDLGCGTGSHAFLLAQRGYRVTGVDRSQEMVECAQVKADETGAATGRGANAPVRFVVGDVRSVDLGQRFDAVISMFAVVSYQLTDDDLLATFATARRHLSGGGTFVFDCWHGPAVLAQQPSVTTKTVSAPQGGTIVRTARPDHDPDARTVTVAYEVTHVGTDGVPAGTVTESHTVRYLFVDEIERLLAEAGCAMSAVGPFGDLSRAPSEQDWNISVVATAL